LLFCGKTMKHLQTFLFYTSVPTIIVFVHTVLFSDEYGSGIDGSLSPVLDATNKIEYATSLRSFIDPVWADWGTEDGQFETLVPPSEIDYGIKNRLPWEQKGYSSKRKIQKAHDSKCDDILLFMPQLFARNGHGSQLNSYFLAAMVATYLGKAMVILEAPQKNSRYPNGSQFGCPIESFKNPEEFLNFKGNDHSELAMKRDFPNGLERLIKHPSWLSRECGIPTCDGTFDYDSWEAIRKDQRDLSRIGKPSQEILCAENRRNVKVTVMGGEEVRQFFNRQYREKMVSRSGRHARERAYNWAVRLGGTHYQAEVFSKTEEESVIWDYVSALIARSGLATFQPWIVRDVKQFIMSTELPLDVPHDSIHVRRGDKLLTDAREEVVNYWHSQGYERQVDFPLNYIPFTHYLRL